MLIRLLYLTSLLAVVAAVGIAVAGVLEWSGGPDHVAWPSVSEGARPAGRGSDAPGEERISPLLAAARGFSSYLNPPAPPVREKPVTQERPRPIGPPVRPSGTSPKFRVRGTVCAGPSERSIALIWEPGARDSGRWVREGAQVGHFVIHEIRAGSVVFLDGDRLCEVAVERESSRTTALAADGLPATPDSQTTMGSARPATTSGRPRRPAGGGRFTVGSARTATLD